MKRVRRFLPGWWSCLILVCVVGVQAGATPTVLEADVCVVGCGSGGFGAALAAGRAGADTIVIEREKQIGGTSTSGLVSLWGAGPGDAFAREIYERLHARGEAGVARRLGKVPYHCWTIDPALRYEDTLTSRTHRVVFDPDAFAREALAMLNETQRCRVLLGTTFTEARVEGRRVTEVRAQGQDGNDVLVRARVFIDATGCLVLCRAVGCETRIGDDLNGITLCYRVQRTQEESDSTVPAAVKPFQRTSCNHELPNGDRIVNMLPSIEGKALLEHGYEGTMALCADLVRRHWAWLRQGPGWGDYRFAGVAPMLGIRESYRIVGEVTLDVSELTRGLAGQNHPDIIAVADHPVDVHGKGKGVQRVRVPGPYGIPYRCLIPRGWENLLVGCRGASFDRAVASSARLSRTILALGHAAGQAGAMAAKAGVSVSAIDVPALVRTMGVAPVAEASVKEPAAATAADAGQAVPEPVAGAAPLPVAGSQRHAFLCTDNGLGKVLRFDAEGTCVWEYPAPGCQDVWLLPNGNILFSYTRHGGPGGVKEVTLDKEVVFSYEADGEVHTCQRLPNGNTMLGVCGLSCILEVTPEGEVAARIPVSPRQKNPHYHMRQVRALPNGHYLVTHPRDPSVCEYDREGNVVRRIDDVGEPFAAVPLPNGNVLVAGGGKVVMTEIAPDGQVVWKLHATDVPEINLKWLAGVQRLPNGNTVVCNWLGHKQAGRGVPLFEISQDKRIVWRFLDNRATRSISSVCLIGEDGVR